MFGYRCLIVVGWLAALPVIGASQSRPGPAEPSLRDLDHELSAEPAFRNPQATIDELMRQNRGIRPSLSGIPPEVFGRRAGPTTPSPPKLPSDGWVSIFDGTSLKGWVAAENPGSWQVRDGLLAGSGNTSHLFYTETTCSDCEFKAEVRINPGGNSGMYFRAQFAPGLPKGYEVQIFNGGDSDPRKTGSLWGFVDVRDQLVGDGEWFSLHVFAKGNHIVIRVNNRIVVDTIETNMTFTSGYLALQVFGERTHVEFKNILMRRLNGLGAEPRGRETGDKPRAGK